VVFALDEQPSAAGDAVLTNRLTKYGLDVKDAFQSFNLHIQFHLAVELHFLFQRCSAAILSFKMFWDCPLSFIIYR
jgi:hypothetical protein